MDSENSWRVAWWYFLNIPTMEGCEVGSVAGRYAESVGGGKSYRHRTLFSYDRFVCSLALRCINSDELRSIGFGH
jgi:hypothetical protein